MMNSTAFLILIWVFLSGSLLPAAELPLAVRDFTLDNGMKFIVVERPMAPVVSLVIGYKVGSVDEKPGITGMAHLCEHMMFKGTRIFGTIDHAKELPYMRRIDSLAEIYHAELAELRHRFDDTGKPRLDSLKNEIHRIQIEQSKLIVKDELWETYLRHGGTNLNASTSNDATRYFVSLPANRLEIWAMMESDRMTGMVSREYYSERDVVHEERRLSLDNEPFGRLEEQLYAAAFTAAGYGWPVVGWASDLETMTRHDLEQFYKKYYCPDNAICAIVGDVDFEEVMRIARKYFGPIPPAGKPQPPTTMEPAQQGERRVEVRFDSEPLLAIGYHTVAANHQDQPVLDVIAAILTRGRTSRLHKRLVENDKTASWVRADAPFSRYPDLFTIWLGPKFPASTADNEKAIYQELESLKTIPVSELELERIRNQLEADFLRDLRSNLGLAFRLVNYEMLTGSWKNIAANLDKRKGVTAEDIMRVAAKYFTPENRTVASIVKKAESQSGAVRKASGD